MYELHGWLFGKWQTLMPIICLKRFYQFAETRATTTQQNTMWQVIHRIKLTQGKLNAVEPDFQCFINGFYKLLAHIFFEVLMVDVHLELFCVFKAYVQIRCNGACKTAATNAKHLGTLHAAVIDHGDIRGAATNVHKH